MSSVALTLEDSKLPVAESGQIGRMIDNQIQVTDSSDRRIPICFVIASITTDRAGTEGHLLRLIRGLNRRRYQPLLVVLQRSSWTDKFNDPLVPMIVLGVRSFLRPLSWMRIWQFARILKQNHIQIVESHFPDAHLVGALAARLANIPTVLSCRRDLVDQYCWKTLALCKLSNHFATHHLVNSHSVAAVASRVEGMQQSRIEVIYNGVDLDAFEQPSSVSTIPQFTDTVTQNRVVVLVANLWPVKNIPMFIDAASIVAKQFDDVCYAVIGSGPEGERLKKLAAERGLKDRLIWTGRVSDIRPYLKQATIGCLSSDSEGFSNSILEYMAAGLPVVATRVGGAPEAIVEGETGYLIPKGDTPELASHLINLLSNPARSRAMGLAGRQRVKEHFSLQAQIDAYQHLYERLTLGAKAPQSI